MPSPILAAPNPTSSTPWRADLVLAQEHGFGLLGAPERIDPYSTLRTGAAV